MCIFAALVYTNHAWLGVWNQWNGMLEWNGGLE